MQLATKYILDNAATDSKVRLASAGWLRSRNAANSGDLQIISTDSSDHRLMGGDLYMGSNQLKGLADPTSAQDAATMAYVQAYLKGLSPKAPVQAATAGALPANTYSNGSSGVGATITGNSFAAIGTIDGYSPSLNDRILVKDEATAAHNGIYVLSVVGNGSSINFVLTRATDADTSAKIQSSYLFAQNGSVGADHEFFNTNVSAPVMGSDDITFVDFGSGSAVTPGNGIDISGGAVSVKISGNGLAFSGSTLQVATQGAGTANTTGIDGSGNVKALKALKSSFTLSSTDITHQYVDLSVVAHTDSIVVQPVGGMAQQEGVDYTVSYTGGASSKTRIDFSAGGLATGSTSALISGDVLMVNCQTL